VSSTALCWIRRDLRLHDHRALAEATRLADRAAVAFVYDRNILDALEDRDDRRVGFIHASLDEVAAGLAEHGSALLARHGDPVETIPRLAQETGASLVVCSHDDDPYALARDAQVAAALGKLGVAMRSVKDHVVLERQEVLTKDGRPYTVFTPYFRAWLERLREDDCSEAAPSLERLAPAAGLPAPHGNLPLSEVGFEPSHAPIEPGARAGRARLAKFVERVHEYHKRRDLFGEDGTSGLSVHLRHGTVSVRECVRAVIGDPRPGAAKWLAELVWREFYHSVLANFPHVVGGAFRREYDAVRWPGSEEHFQAWCEGRTGYPVVDAAMRCLVATGLMHNRLRMVCAMFLTKDLLVDWRKGEAFFARHLLDFELASNNGGWQWSASTGVDAQPYFRVFNPVLQSRKFDPHGGFIRRWCPELAGLSDDDVHWPHGKGQPGLPLLADYPPPIVDHSVQRERAVALLSVGLSSTPS
jgi:deoxyribodipyrimidine photo-lyase